MFVLGDFAMKVNIKLILSCLMVLYLPTLANAQTIETPMDFDKCKNSAQSTMNAMGATYDVVFNTSTIFMVKTRVSDGTVSVGCYKETGKQVIITNAN